MPNESVQPKDVSIMQHVPTAHCAAAVIKIDPPTGAKHTQGIA